MTRQYATRNQQQSRSETPLVSGILQRAGVRSVPEKEVQPSDEIVSPSFRDVGFHQDFSQVPVQTGTLPVIQPKLRVGRMGNKDEEGNRKAKEVVHQENKTGLSDNLKAGIENLSGLSMDDVRVHYNSGQPAQLQALAYTQGTDIHVAPGQEKHLPHEAWHVVQQKQGRVKPTKSAIGVDINEDKNMEREADVMSKIVNHRYELKSNSYSNVDIDICSASNKVIQKKVDIEYENLTVNDDARVKKISTSRLNMPEPNEVISSLDSLYVPEGETNLTVDSIKKIRGQHNRHIIPDHLMADFVVSQYEGKPVQDIKNMLKYNSNAKNFDSWFKKTVESKLSELNSEIQNLNPYGDFFRGGYKGQLGYNQWYGEGEENEKRAILHSQCHRKAQEAQKNGNQQLQSEEALMAFAVDFDPSPNMNTEEYKQRANKYTELYNRLVQSKLRVAPIENGKERLFRLEDVLSYQPNLDLYKRIQESEQLQRNNNISTRSGRRVRPPHPQKINESQKTDSLAPMSLKSKGIKK
jgi:hypothetical protein